MKSIRTYLLLTLLATITVVSFLSVLHGYRSSIDKVDELFDQRLIELAEIIVHANQDTLPRDEHSTGVKPSVFFQIWSADKALLARSENAPDIELLASLKSNTFNEVNANEFRWRTFTLKDELLNRWVITAERVDLRYGLADTIVSEAIRPTVVAIPIAALIIWLVIGLGLRPLKQLAQQLSNKRADDLTPVLLEQSPRELTQLISTTNDLLSRLNAAFTREQQFSADAAHELRTPISALNVQLHNLKQERSLSEDELRPLSEGIQRMGHVVEQILSLYRNAPDQGLCQQQTVDLYEVAQRVMANEYCQLQKKNQEISLFAEAGCFIDGDQFALETLVQNLVVNAGKYSPEASKIEVSINKLGDSMTLVVEDSGTGIAEADYERVFERFYRVGGDRHDSGEVGCGLGLAIVKHIVVMHGASITLGRSHTLGGLQVNVTFKGV